VPHSYQENDREEKIKSNIFPFMRPDQQGSHQAKIERCVLNEPILAGRKHYAYKTAYMKKQGEKSSDMLS
jgi:hypothetical protein